MTCPTETLEGIELLAAWTAGRADAPTDVAEHVRACAACRLWTEEHGRMWTALDLWEAPAVSADFDRKLYSRIEQGSRWRDALARLLAPRWIPAAAAITLLAAVGLWVDRPGPAPAPAPPAAQVEAMPADLAADALEEMEVVQEFNRLVPVADTGRPRM